MDCDIAIVGAGPVGAIAALNSVKRNAAVYLFEQRKKIGYPDHCAGLLSTSGLESLRLPNIPQSIIQNDGIKGAMLYSPSGLKFCVKRANTQAFVVDRSLFDNFIAMKAAEAGVRVFLERKVTKIDYNKKKKSLFITCLNKNTKMKENFSSFVSIIATGTRQSIKTIHPNFKPTKCNYLSSYQILADNVKDLNVELVELFFSNRVAPGLFAWIIPINESQAKVGLASNERFTKDRLNFFLNKYSLTKDRFTKTRIVKTYGGQIILNGYRRKTIFDGMMLAGDAAGQTKATTGGGVVTGCKAGIIAGQIASQAVEARSNNAAFLKLYEERWKGLLLHQLKQMTTLRWMLDHLNDKALDIVFKTIISEQLDQIIVKKGNIDHQAEVIQSLLKHPTIMKLGVKVLPHTQW